MGSANRRNTLTPFGLGPNTITVGDGGDFATVQQAVDYINTTNRYTVEYSTGTATLVNGSRSFTATGGADWTSLSNTANGKEYWLYLDSANIFLPLIGVAPRLASSWGNYGELKYQYDGTGAAKSYQLVSPNWYHILLLPGEVIDPTKINWPHFVTLSGIDRESCIWRGAIHVDASAPGIWMRNFTWGSIYGVAQSTEEALITVDDTVQSAEAGYAELVMANISGGRGNADRDITYRTSSMISHALFQCTDSDLYAHYDVIQCTARNVIFQQNNVYVHTQDTTVMDPTGFRWFSGSNAPETNLFIDLSNNNFVVMASAGARTCRGLLLIQDSAAYLTAPPDVYGRLYNNNIQVHQLGTGDATGVECTPFLMGANNGKMLIDANTFDIVSSGGSRKDVYTHATASFFMFGRNNVTRDGSSFNITGSPYRTENKGTSSAIASGATIAHGLRATPTEIAVTPADAGVTDFYATADGTNITVTYSGGGTHAFNWKVSV